MRLDACTAMGACAAIRLASAKRRRSHLVVVDDFRYQSHFITFTSGQRFAGKNDFAGFRPTNQPWQNPSAAGFRHDTARGESCRQLSCIRHNAHVTAQRHVHAVAAADPFNAAMVGVSMLWRTVGGVLRKSKVGETRRERSLKLSVISLPRRSKPAQKNLPVPVMIIARTSSVASASSSSSLNRASMSLEIVFAAPGD